MQTTIDDYTPTAAGKSLSLSHSSVRIVEQSGEGSQPFSLVLAAASVV